MSQSSGTTQFWTAAAALIALSPLAILCSLWWGWTPGAGSLVLLSIPGCAVALTGTRRQVAALSAFVGAVCLGEALLTAGTTNTAAWEFTALSVGALVGGMLWLAVVFRRLHLELQRLEEQNTQHVREIYQRSRAEHAASKPADESPPGGNQPGGGKISYPMLLLTLQDIGRRVSTNRDWESLIPVIINTAKVTLQCRQCEVYLWNRRDKTLTNALPNRVRERSEYTPHPTKGMTAWVLEQRQILTRASIQDDYNLRRILDEDPSSPDAIAPLTVGGETLGILIVDGVEDVSPNFSRLLYVLANLYALGIKNAQLFQRIEEMARRDGLTGLLNHASFQQQLQEQLAAATAANKPLTIVMSDIDRFKSFNDTYGHQAGDHVLREVARLWKAVLPDYAVIARYGGEEFICALPDDDEHRGRELAELLRQTIEEHTFDFEGQTLHVTSSFGVAAWNSSATTPQELIKTADELLYQAKEGGRNRVICAGQSFAVARLEA